VVVGGHRPPPRGEDGVRADLQFSDMAATTTWDAALAEADEGVPARSQRPPPPPSFPPPPDNTAATARNRGRWTLSAAPPTTDKRLRHMVLSAADASVRI